MMPAKRQIPCQCTQKQTKWIMYKKKPWSKNQFDNDNVILPTSEFPDSETDKGVSGFIRSFDFTLSADTVEVEFNLNFEIATVVP